MTLVTWRDLVANWSNENGRERFLELVCLRGVQEWEGHLVESRGHLFVGPGDVSLVLVTVHSSILEELSQLAGVGPVETADVNRQLLGCLLQ